MWSLKQTALNLVGILTNDGSSDVQQAEAELDAIDFGDLSLTNGSQFYDMSNQCMYSYVDNGWKYQYQKGSSGGGGGGGSLIAEPKDVNFYDYDGTCVASYTATEFTSLTELPSNPSHEGLVAQGWNWTLADAKTHVSNNGSLNIGQMYTTDTGETRIYVTLFDDCLEPASNITVNGTAQFDWGDGSAKDTLTGDGTSQSLAHHTYSRAGDYVITITPGDSSTVTLSFTATATFTTGNTLFNSFTDTPGTSLGNGKNTSYANCIKKIEIGDNVEIGTTAFKNLMMLEKISMPLQMSMILTSCFAACRSLKWVALPSGLTGATGDSVFDGCSSLQVVSLPKGITSIGQYAFRGCSALKSITLPDTVTQIISSAFANVSSLEHITLPNNLTQVQASAFVTCPSLQSVYIVGRPTLQGSTFDSCANLVRLRFKSTTPPTVQSNTCFGSFKYMYVYVPQSVVNTYRNAQNYPRGSAVNYIGY